MTSVGQAFEDRQVWEGRLRPNDHTSHPNRSQASFLQLYRNPQIHVIPSAEFFQPQPVGPEICEISGLSLHPAQLNSRDDLLLHEDEEDDQGENIHYGCRHEELRLSGILRPKAHESDR